jgi:xanthine dehydrogenase accessory factor
MEIIYSKALELQAKKEFCVLATIIRLTGSGPRGAGTKFLIMEDGSYAGTIGGGLLEAKVLETANKVFATRSPTRLSLNLMGKDVAGTDMICGGDAEILLEPVFPDDEGQTKILRRSMEIQKRGGFGLVVTALDLKRWEKGKSPKVFVDSGEELTGSLHGMEGTEGLLSSADLEQWIKNRTPGVVVHKDREGRQIEFFVDPVVSDQILYVFGAGHVSLQIVPLASKVGFKTVVIDDRPDFADPANFPEAEKVLQYSFDGVLEKLPVDESSFVIIVTRGHIHDKTVLEQCLRTKAEYIGMIGSRRKKAMIYEKLLEEGFTRHDLDRVYAPIGLDIGAETPEEIAVSIVAELIQVRAGKGTTDQSRKHESEKARR